MQNVQLDFDLCTQITKSVGQMLMKYFTSWATEMLNFHIIIRYRWTFGSRLWTGCCLRL